MNILLCAQTLYSGYTLELCNQTCLSSDSAWPWEGHLALVSLGDLMKSEWLRPHVVVKSKKYNAWKFLASWLAQNEPSVHFNQLSLIETI